MQGGIKVNRKENMNKKSRKFVPGKVEELPKDFFETVLECEVRLKEKFDMAALKKLIDYYSTAVGYYESINDPKYMIYNQSLSLLLTQPEVKKYLGPGNINAKLKKEQLLKLIHESEKKVTNDSVKSFIRRKTVDSKKTINKLISKDMEGQSNDFKKRLEEKKKRYRLSISTDVSNENFNNAIKSVGLKVIHPSNMDNSNNEEVLSGNNLPIVNNSNVNNNNILDELKKEDLKNENKEGNLEEDTFEKKLEMETKGNRRGSVNKNIKYTNKTMFLDKMKLHFDIYSNDYFDNFMKKYCDQIIKDYNGYFNELTQTLTDSAVNYINQEKEMEFLITNDADETYKNEITTIVQQLKEEDKVTSEKLISENKSKMEKLNEKYLGTLNSIQTGHDLEMLKERFKLDTTKSVNTLVFK